MSVYFYTLLHQVTSSYLSANIRLNSVPFAMTDKLLKQ